MRELGAMWRNTRMVVLCAISAALYAAVLVPFKVVPLIPGVTELRPANAIPVVCSFLFGPAAAWGSAIGNISRIRSTPRRIAPTVPRFLNSH